MEKIIERRQDVGLKAIYGISGGIIMFLVTLFFNHTYNMANEAYSIATTATKDVAVLNQCISEITRRLGSIDSKLDTIIGNK
jgi:hypothetical protein